MKWTNGMLIDFQSSKNKNIKIKQENLVAEVEMTIDINKNVAENVAPSQEDMNKASAGDEDGETRKSKDAGHQEAVAPVTVKQEFVVKMDSADAELKEPANADQQVSDASSAPHENRPRRQDVIEGIAKPAAAKSRVSQRIISICLIL